MKCGHSYKLRNFWCSMDVHENEDCSVECEHSLYLRLFCGVLTFMKVRIVWSSVDIHEIELRTAWLCMDIHECEYS